MRGKEMHRAIIKGLTKNKIYLEAVQEANITRDSNYMMGNYRITASEDKNEETGIATGGTAIMEHESMKQHITQIARQSGRALRVTLGHAESKIPIHIISTYAPRKSAAQQTQKGERDIDGQTLKNYAARRAEDAS